MRSRILYLFFLLTFFSCKTRKKQNYIDEITENTTQIHEKKAISDKFKENKNTFSIPDSTLSNSEERSNSLRDKVIGKTYSYIDEIDEFKDFNSGGASVGEVDDKDYSLSVVRTTEDVPMYVTFEQSFLSDSKRKFKIIDVLDLTHEKLLKDEGKGLHIHFCRKDGRQDEEIIAIAQYDEYAEFLTKIYKAWRADRKTEKIIEISTDGITVENMDYGL